MRIGFADSTIWQIVVWNFGEGRVIADKALGINLKLRGLKQQKIRISFWIFDTLNAHQALKYVLYPGVFL